MIEIIDENTIRTSPWGIVRFKLAPKGRNDRWICSHCLLLRSQTEEECGQIPCCASRRSDGLNGYFYTGLGNYAGHFISILYESLHFSCPSHTLSNTILDNPHHQCNLSHTI